jgi:gluconolactonase
MAGDLAGIVAGTVERLATGFQFTEGPLWHPGGHWAFVDTRPNLVYTLAPGGTPEVLRRESGRSNGLTFDLQGRLLMCEGYGRRISRMEADGSVSTVADSWQGQRLNRPNDIVCRSDGSVYFTDPRNVAETTAWEIPFNGVFRVPPAGGIEVAVQDLPYPNGLAFSPDERVLYVANTRGPMHVAAFDVGADGRLSNRRTLVEMAAGDGGAEGAPDGMKVDVDGRVYCTGPGGIWVMEPDGRHLGTLPVPEAPSNCAFGGPDYQTLFITARTSVYAVSMHTRGAEPPGARALRR